MAVRLKVKPPEEDDMTNKTDHGNNGSDYIRDPAPPKTAAANVAAADAASGDGG